MSNYQRPALCWGNDFTLNIELERFVAEDVESFDLTKCKSIEVYLFCGSHNTKIPLKWTITGDDNNILSCFVDYRVTHPNQAYGICVEGDYENDKHFRWYMQPKEGILIINNTSGQYIPDEEEVVDLKGRVGFAVPSQDLSDYYTKEETNDLLDDKQELLVSGTNIKTINNQSILGEGNINIQIPEQEQADWTETDSTAYSYIQNKPDLSAYATKSDLNDYYDKTETDTMLDAKADASDLNDKQDTLQSGVNIKTINNQSILGSGNIDIHGGGEQVQADWNEDDTTDPAYIQNKPDLDDMQEVIANALLDNDAKIDNVQYNIIPETRQALNKRIDETNAAIQNAQSLVNGQLDALDDQLYTAAQALNDLKESMPEGGVTSFNGATGAVTYEAPVTSVNGMTGAVTIQTGGGGVESFNGMTGAVTYEAPVSSVNGQTGAVTIDTGVTSFNGATGAVTYEAPVTSVNGMTGAVTIQTGGDPGFIKITNGSNVGLVSSLAVNYNTNIGNWSIIEGRGTASFRTEASGACSHAEGQSTQALGICSHVEGTTTVARNNSEHAEGQYNVSTLTNTTFGNDGNTLSSIGNGKNTSNKHNAIEIRQNGDIYYSDTEKIDNSTVYYYTAPMRKLQDAMVTSTTNGLKIEVVQVLPASPDTNTIYIVQ